MIAKNNNKLYKIRGRAKKDNIFCGTAVTVRYGMDLSIEQRGKFPLMVDFFPFSVSMK
jgi:hypothetical protein